MTPSNRLCLSEKLISKHTRLKSEHEIYRSTRGLNLGSSDRPSRSVRTVSQPTEPPRQALSELNSDKFWKLLSIFAEVIVKNTSGLLFATRCTNQQAENLTTITHITDAPILTDVNLWSSVIDYRNYKILIFLPVCTNNSLDISKRFHRKRINSVSQKGHPIVAHYFAKC